MLQAALLLSITAAVSFVLGEVVGIVINFTGIEQMECRRALVIKL